MPAEQCLDCVIHRLKWDRAFNYSLIIFADVEFGGHLLVRWAAAASGFPAAFFLRAKFFVTQSDLPVIASQALSTENFIALNCKAFVITTTVDQTAKIKAKRNTTRWGGLSYRFGLAQATENATFQRLFVTSVLYPWRHLLLFICNFQIVILDWSLNVASFAFLLQSCLKLLIYIFFLTQRKGVKTVFIKEEARI